MGGKGSAGRRSRLHAIPGRLDIGTRQHEPLVHGLPIGELSGQRRVCGVLVWHLLAGVEHGLYSVPGRDILAGQCERVQCMPRRELLGPEPGVCVRGVHGTYSLAGASACQACAVGAISSNSASGCTSCTPGSYAPSGSMAMSVHLELMENYA